MTATKDEALRVAREEMARYLPILMRLEDSPLWSEFTAGLGIATINGYVAALRTIALAGEAPSDAVQSVALGDPKGNAAVRVPFHPNLKGLAAALRSQRQVDEDGTEVGVSRQAADEAATIIEALAADPASASGAVGETAGLNLADVPVPQDNSWRKPT